MSNKKQIAVIYDSFPHYRTGIIRELSQSATYQYLFVGARAAPNEEGIKRWDPEEGVSFLATKLYYPFGRCLIQSKVISLALRRDIDSVIFLGDAVFVTTWVAAIIARLTGKKVFFWTHGWTELDVGIKKLFRISFYRLANTLLLYGHHAKQLGLTFGFRQERMHVIYNSLDCRTQVAIRASIDEEELRSIRTSLFAELSDNPILICTGRLIPVRHLNLLLDAMSFLKKEGFPVNLILVGDGPDAPLLRRQSKCGNLSVNFYGSCYDEQVLARLFMVSDLLVMPGRIGLAAMHSLVYGTPVVVHDNPNDQGPEWEAVMPGFNGAHFAHGDSRDLARVIRQWLENAPDRLLLRTRCQSVVETFFNPSMQAKLIESALVGAPADDFEWKQFVHMCHESSTPHISH